ncbi:hypothetical protein M0802_014402 [Mischocyttarus mexicanus]|nr:hypothetical protein M0802_014402 [Mischocyttarus mexicanus]
MSKNIASSNSNMEPSAPVEASLPAGPPTYEEAIAYGGEVPNPPYPIGITSMPMSPNYNQPPKQITMPVPMPSSYVVPTDRNVSQSFNTDQNFAPPPEVRIIHQHVTFALGPHAIKMTCPSCHADIKTTTISDHQPAAHICCIILCLLGQVI